MEEDNKEYKIKVNKTFLDKENSKKNNNKMNNYPFKKSVLYNLKINPEIIINEFHQTSNNINTNINIKKDKSKNSEFLSRNNNTIFNDNNDSNNEPLNKNYLSYDYDYFKINDRNKDFSYNKTFTNNKTIQNDYEILPNERPSFNDKYSPLTSKISYYTSNTYKKKDKNHYIRNIKFNQLARLKNKISDYIIPYMEENIKIKRPNAERNKKFNKFNITNSITEMINDYIYSNHKKSMEKRINHLSQDEITISNKENNYDNRNISINLSNIYNKTIPEGLKSIPNKKIVHRNYNLNTLNNNEDYNNLHKSCEKREKYKSNTYADWNVHKTLNLKLMNYRIKLFSQFHIHFEKYYKTYIRNYQRTFFKRLKYYTYNKINDNLENIKLRNMRTSDYYKSFKDDNKNNYLLELYKFSTTNDFYNINDPKTIYTEFKSSIFNDFEEKNDDNYNLSLLKLKKDIFNSTAREDKDDICFSDRRHFLKKKLFNSMIKSPISKLNNQTYKNEGMGLDNENYKKENELFRNLEELNKKGEQIKKRRISKKNEKKLFLDNNNKSSDIKKIRDTKEYGQFSELRNKINKVNKNNINKLHINNKMNKYCKVNLGKQFNKTLYNFHPKDVKEEKNKNNTYRKEVKIPNSKIINLKKINNSNKKINNNIISYKKVKININTKFFSKDITLKNVKNNITNSINNNKKNIYVHKKKTDLIDNGRKLVNDIRTKDNRININIFYYNYSKRNKTTFSKYDLLYESNNFSMNLINNFNSNKRNFQNKRKQILSSIKEEEVSNQNSKIIDEGIISFNISNNCDIKNQKEANILKFINILEAILIHIYKRILLIRMKTINIVNKIEKILFNSENKKNINHNKNKSCSVYIKKFGIKAKKEINNKDNKNLIEENNY